MKHTLKIVFDDKVHSFAGGFRTNWIDGEDKKHKINLTCGAGCGSPYMHFTIEDKKTGKSKTAMADIRPLVQTLAERMS